MQLVREKMQSQECGLSLVQEKSRLMEHVYGIGEDVSDTAIEVLVSRLRKKIAPFGIEIKMARGLGYYLRVDK